MVAALSGGVALAQASSPQSTSPSSSTDQSATQAQPAAPGQSSTASSASLSQAQSQVQDALNKQMSSGNVAVSTTSDNQIQLTGTVSSASDKQHAEDIAKAAAPGQTIVNNIKVGGSSDSTNPK